MQSTVIQTKLSSISGEFLDSHNLKIKKIVEHYIWINPGVHVALGPGFSLSSCSLLPLSSFHSLIYLILY